MELHVVILRLKLLVLPGRPCVRVLICFTASVPCMAAALDVPSSFLSKIFCCWAEPI